MPGIFLYNANKENEDSATPGVALAGKTRERFWSVSKLTKAFFLLALLCIPLSFVNWNGPPKVLDLPSKHVDFMGREKEIALLKKRLLIAREKWGINLVAIYGEGGIGKTELATTFANDNMDKFSLVGWLDGSSEESFMHSYGRLGDVLEIREDNPVRLREKVHAKLESLKGRPWLLIMDDMREIPSKLPKSGGAVIVTCRDKSICPLEFTMELTKDPGAAALLLSKLTHEIKSESIDKLAEKLDYLPLMINLAGHYIAETPGISFSNYSDIISDLMETEESPLKTVEFRKRYPRSLSASYHITLELLEKKHPLSLEFLKEINSLHHKNIPEDLITVWLEEKNTFSPAQIVQIKGDILRELRNHSLIRYDSNRGEFSIHQLLHQTLSLEFNESEKTSDVVKVLTKFNPVRFYNPTHKNTIRPFQKVLPHCMAILEKIQTPDYSGVSLALTVARYFVDTEHHFKKGKKYLDLAKHWTENWDHPVCGRIEFLQGMVQFREAEFESEENEKRQKYLQALECFNQALRIFEAQDNNALYQGIEQNTTKCTKEYQRAICMQFQGQTMRAMGRLDEAEKVLIRALAAFQAISGGKDHYDIARILREQALILWDLGHQELAQKKLEEAMSMQVRVYGDAYSYQPTVAATYRILGVFCQKRGEFVKADEAYQKAIAISQDIYQTEVHPYLADLYDLRADLLFAQGKTELAKKIKEEALKIQTLLKQSA